MPDLTPQDVAGREFRSAFRGYEPAEVKAFLSEVASGLRALLDEVQRLRSHASAATPADIQAEIDTVSSEIHSVLRTAQEAAESIRERASNDATRWRSEAVAEVETMRKEAAVDAESLRADAWTTSEQLLSQCQAEAERIVEDAKREALRIVGEAERESHRLQAAARRESEDLVRAARMDAEQLQADARARHDELIQDAIRQSESAQERTLALERRRQELLGELESVRSTLTQVEDALDQRRESLGLSPASEAVGKVVKKDEPPATPTEAPGKKHETWVPGETVRVVRPSRPGEEVAAEITAQPPQPEVKVLSGRQFARIKAGLDPDEEMDEADGEGEGGRDAADDIGGADRSGGFEAPQEFQVEDKSLLDQREDERSVTVRLVERSSSGEDHAKPEPEMLEPEDFTGPIGPQARGAEPGDTDGVEQTVDAGDDATAESSSDEIDGEDEPDASTELTAELDEARPGVAPPSAEGPVELGQDDSEGGGGDESLEAGGEPEPEPEPEPAAASGRYNFGDHVVVTGAHRPAWETRDVVQPPVGPSEPGEVEESSATVAGEDDQPSLFGDVEGLFDRLRVDEPRRESPASTSEEVPGDIESMMSRRLTTAMVDPFEVRDRMLLPVGNRALRNLKRQLTEAQNVALEEIRLDESAWHPAADALHERLRADLVVLFAESFGAGHSAAEEMLGGRVPRPATPQTDVVQRFVSDLTADLEQVVGEGRAAGQGARQLGATLSRVFRGWRTDQAERRVRDLSLTGYHLGLMRSFDLGGGPDLRWKVAGRGCATCRAAADERPEGSVPPAHPGCECTVGP